MATKERALNEMFVDLLRDIYFAEKQILRALPKMAKAANTDGLRTAFEQHREETEGQVERLERVFEIVGQTPRGKTCDAILGIIQEGKDVMEDYADSPALDAGLVAAAQAVEHYEMARYGTLKAWAGLMGSKDIVKLLDETLAQEQKADTTLTALAEKGVNQRAMPKAA